MAHKPLIDGTAYEISGGKTLVGGTAYSIDKGKTLVGGTVYEVGFGPGTATVTVTHGAYDTEYWWTDCSTTLPDGSYVSLNSAGTYELPIGTVIKCGGGHSHSSHRRSRMTVYLNEVQVAQAYGENNINCSYDYTLGGNVTIDPKSDPNHFDYDGDIAGAIFITEE